MRKFIITIAVFFIIPCSFAQAAEDRLRTNYSCYDENGNSRWQATAEIVPDHDKEEGFYILTEKGEGYYTGFKDKIVWFTTMEFLHTEDMIRPLNVTKHIFDEDEKEIAVETQSFDFKNKKAVYSYKDLLNNKKREKKFDFKDEIVNRLILCLYVQNFLADGLKEKRVQLLTTDPQIYKLNIKVIAKEEITLDGSKIDAYKICVDPDVGFLNMFKGLFPKAYLWHKADGDFTWLEYLGPETSPSSKKVKIEKSHNLMTSITHRQ